MPGRKQKAFPFFALKKHAADGLSYAAGERQMTTIRENLEKWEEKYLSPYATLSQNSLGRLKDEEPCDIRPVFQRDRDRILHCKAFAD